MPRSRNRRRVGRGAGMASLSDRRACLAGAKIRRCLDRDTGSGRGLGTCGRVRAGLIWTPDKANRDGPRAELSGEG